MAAVRAPRHWTLLLVVALLGVEPCEVLCSLALLGEALHEREPVAIAALHCAKLASYSRSSALIASSYAAAVRFRRAIVAEQ